MTEINITEAQYDNFIKVVEGVMHEVIVEDTFEFNHMLGMNGFNGFAPRQEIAIMGILEDELTSLVDEENKERAKELAYKLSMALESAVAGLQTLHKKYKFKADEVYEFCKDSFRWLLGINHSPSMFETMFNVVYPSDSENEEDPEDN
jgi:hypothetical protein